MEHVTEKDIEALEDKAEDLTPDDFASLPDEQSLHLPAKLYTSLAKEEPGSEVMLVVKGIIGGGFFTGPNDKEENKTIRVNIRHAFLVHGRVLTTKARKALRKSQFAIPGKEPGPGSFPIPDVAHARNALARVSQFGSRAEKAKVRAAVRRKFPGIKIGGDEK